MKTKLIGILSILLFLASCATSFRGDAHLTPGQCMAKCESWGMALDSMVAMGEYSDACVCKNKSKGTSYSTEAASSSAGAVGVVLQMRKQKQQRNAQGM